MPFEGGELRRLRIGASSIAEREPAWLLLLSGWLFASAVLTRLEPIDGSGLAPLPGPGSPAVPPVIDELRSGPRAIELERSPPRELRRLPAIGRKRAIELARARWEQQGGAPFDLTAVRGIGARTEELVRAWLDEEGER